MSLNYILSNKERISFRMQEFSKLSDGIRERFGLNSDQLSYAIE